MKTRSWFYVLVIFFVTACSDEPRLSRLPIDAVILAFGDSLTHGNGASPAESYPAVLAGLSGRQVINAGISGEVSEAGLKRLPDLLTLHQPRLLILCHGGNDFLRKKDLGELESNLREMISLARSQNIDVLMLGVPRLGLFLSSADLYGKIAEDTGVLFIEDLVPDVLADRSLKSDTVHPNNRGYRVMAEGIHASLQEAGAL